MNTSIFKIDHEQRPPGNTASIKNLITPREFQVLRLIAFEHSTKEVASKLFVSYETANSHRQNLMRKLSVKNTAGLVRVAFERKLLTLS